MGLASGPCATGSSGTSQLELEAVLLSMSPAELVVLEPVSTSTMRMLQAYVSSVPGCRLERLRGWGPHTSTADVHKQLKALCTDSGAARLQAALRLPRHAQLSLAAASHHLESFGLEGVLRLQPARPVLVPDQEPQDVCQPDQDLQDVRPDQDLQGGSPGLDEGGKGEEQEAGSMSAAMQAAGLQPMQRTQALHLGPNALRQLEVVASSDDGQYRGSLLHLLDRTSSSAGGRLLRAWVASPLTDASLINARLDAVEELAGVKGASQRSAGPLSRLPDALRRIATHDLERGLTRLLHRTAPPSELVTTLGALKEIPTSLGLQYDPTTQELDMPPGAVTSPLINALLAAAAAPDAHAACARFLGCLDVKAAKANRTVDCLTDPEQFEDVSKAKQAVQDALDALKALLPGLAKQLSVRSIEYVSIQNQGDWLIEVPIDQEKRVPKTWNRVCGTKKVGRYHPPSVRDAMLDLAIAREQLDVTALNAYNRFLASFMPYYAVCKAAASALAQLDALSALAAVARSPGYCRPVVLSPAQAPPQLLIRGGRHPMLDAQLEAGAGPRAGGAGAGATGAVPNDVVLEATGCRAAIVTGPNMGGKSCLVRQAALTAIMAQVGSFVPADSCRMTALDGVYTRMGASDNLLLGRSTFLEELGDASYILANATNRSLVIMDELGRGTATHDGVAIATATLSHLVSHIQCLTLFVTHYPEVAQMCDSHPQHVRAFHMAYMRDDEDQQNHTCDTHAMQVDEPGHAATPSSQPAQPAADMSGQASDVPAQATAGPIMSGDAGAAATRAPAAIPAAPRITFLYKLVQGAADQSFGLNVAQMAGLPRGVVSKAAERAAALQQAAARRKAITATQRITSLLRDARGAVSEDSQRRTILQAALAELPSRTN